MMPANVMPTTKGVYLCDDVVGDSLRGKIHLFGVFNAVRPGEKAYPYRLKRMVVFAQMTGGLGQMPIQVDVVDAATDNLVFHSAKHPIEFPDRLTTISVSIKIKNCVFPRAGAYLVELYCADTFLDDRLLRLLAENGARQ